MSHLKVSLLGITLLISGSVFCQELFILNEPASSVPKNVFGARAFTQNYKEYKVNRSLNVLRLMYGVTPKLSLMIDGSISNHHDRRLPKDLINHSHLGNQTTYFTQPIKRGVKYPTLFNGIHAFAKYRFVTKDDKNKHFRMSAYGEWSNVRTAHDEAEPNLMDDTGGYGAGLISTWLKDRVAVSLTTGFIDPTMTYSEYQRDETGGPDLFTTIKYGSAVRYNLSFGYRLYPKKYEASYEQVNWNVYVEFIGKSYQAADVVQGGVDISARTASLKSGSYMEIYPGIQRIVNSNTRIELSYGFNLLGFTYVHFTPIWTLAVQRYFYPRIKKERKT
jgi:hypothetical protein